MGQDKTLEALEAEKKEWEQAAYDQVNELNDRIEALEADVQCGIDAIGSLVLERDELQSRIEAGLKLEQEWRAGVIGSNEAMTRLREALGGSDAET